LKFPRAIVLAVLTSGTCLLCTSCHVHSSATASFSFDASVSFGDAAAPPLDSGLPTDADTDAGDVDAGGPLLDRTPADFALRFERTACLGTCPMYTVFIDAHGAVRFSSRLMVGDHFVDGCATKNIGDRGVADIRAVLAKNRYFSLRNEYVGGPTDAPWVNTSVTENHKTKIVKHYTGAPIPAADALHLYTVEDAIDRLSGAADFAKKGGSLTPCTYTGN
jgi:hypothetical protein